MKKLSLIIILLIIILSFFIFWKKTPTATIDNKTFFIDLAISQKDQEIGLAKYKKISLDKGMYFVFSRPDYYSFWMKDMKFPIDIIFIRNQKIVTIFDNVPLPQVQKQLPIYQPSWPADSVLEISAGLSKKYGFKIGDSVQLTK